MYQNEKCPRTITRISTKATQGYYTKKYNSKKRKKQETMLWVYDFIRGLIMLGSLCILCFLMILVGG